MTQTHYRPEPTSLVQAHAFWCWNSLWLVDWNRYRIPWLQYTLWVCLWRLRLVLRVHLPWRKP